MKLLVCIDVDGTISNPGNRFFCEPVPDPANRTNPAYQKYLDIVQSEEKIMEDKPLPGMQKFLESFLQSNLVDVVYVTARDDKHRKTTMKWLHLHNFPTLDLHMRGDGDQRSSADYKENVIRTMSYMYSNVILIDDDESMEEMCMRNGWRLLQSKNGGLVL